ncbi:MAG: zinc ABC transporter substrate-binding protein [Planctomycetota bacterium]
MSPLLCALLVACDNAPPQPTPQTEETTTPTIVVTDPQLACLIEPALPATVTLTTIAPDDPEAHATRWSPDRAQARTLRNADLVVTAGAGTDAWLAIIGLRDDRVLRLAGADTDPLIPIATETHSHGPGGEHSHTVYAPRPWHAPDLAQRMTESIGARLRADGLVDSVAYDDSEVRSRLATIDAIMPGSTDNLLVVTTSDAWRYAAQRVGAGVLVVDDDAEPATVRVEISSTTARRVILIGDVDAQGVRGILRGSGINVIDIPTGDDACSWLDTLETFARAVTAP